ncbi:family 20 glycosylhydrolase [Algoriphagus boritolerans]|uniref:family 20 glycosylhydrolase n=1 Tax=Algoriphagus boritolerans TaxID=308111 RepID=UPI002FCE39D7
MQYDSTSRIGLHWAAYVELDSAYLWEPSEYAEGITAADILGVEAPLWTETVTNRADIDYLVFPRIAAIAEVAWTTRTGEIGKDLVKEFLFMEKNGRFRG